MTQFDISYVFLEKLDKVVSIPIRCKRKMLELVRKHLNCF